MKNWWYYHKWYVVSALIVLLIVVDVLGSRFHLWEKRPDCEIAYMAKMPLSDEQVDALTAAFEMIVEDGNKDGTVNIKLHQYIINPESTDDDALYRQYAGEVQLIGDISDCDSFFYITDDPGRLQRAYHILANPDGSCPADADYQTQDKVLLLQDISPVSDRAALFPDPLYLGIRCFYQENQSVAYLQTCMTAWNSLYSKTI